MNPIMMNSNLSRISGFVNMIKGSRNPQQMMMNSPQMQEVMKMVQGKNPEEVFYQKCQEMGVNPDVILGMLR